MSTGAYSFSEHEASWLTQSPPEWPVSRCKWALESISAGIWGSDPESDDEGITCVRVADFDRTHHRVVPEPPTRRLVTATELESRRLEYGNLLIEKSGGGAQQPVGCVVRFTGDYEAVCSNFIARLVLQDVQDSAFWTYMHAALYASQMNIPSIKQTTGIQNLDLDAFLSLHVAVPPLPVQRTIASYLDRETAKLDAMIEAKERVLALLAEKRRALITHAVTRGLNPDVPMKDSGVEWLGEIPEHWDVVPLKYGFRSISSGTTPATSKQEYYNGTIPWVTTSELRENIITDTKTKLTEEAIRDYSSLRTYPVGSVLFAMYGATIGRVAQLGIPATVNQAVCVFSHPTRFDPEFAILALRASRDYLVELATGGGQPNLNGENIANHPIACPSIDEQRAVVALVKHQTSSINQLANQLDASISLLRERRSSLITAAVTGQIDVEDAA
ncbi:MAG TPA: restriction endonuclease subunit S [Phycisphaerales bacterium]|nr:restriction endonuclease subunit S [Phycisphaerales bacterium]